MPSLAHARSSEEEFVAVPKVQGYNDVQEKFRQKADANVVSIRMNILEGERVFATGDSVFCAKCQAVLNCYSIISTLTEEGKESASQLWKCEFCENENIINLEEEEIPKEDTLDFILMSPEQVVESDSNLNNSDKDITIVFCIDVSGSMCVTQPMEGNFALKGKIANAFEGFGDFDMSEQFLPGEDNVTYVSRLQCVQAAIESQLEEMQKYAPDRKVGIVTFNNEVTIIGDGTTDTQSITGDRLSNFQTCYDIGENLQSKMTKTISETSQALTDKLMKIEETGPTALGPALIASIGLASGGKPGSKVIICTDGLSNVGIGSLDTKNEAELLLADGFYTQAGSIAKEKGIGVSVISIQGEECRIESLSAVAELTEGNVTRVDPANLTQDFANILHNPIIATQVSVVVKMHNGLTFRNEEEGLIDKSTLRKDLGNVNNETEMTFEFSLRQPEELKELGIDPTSQEKISFQTQINYTAPDGMKCLRVITAQQDITNDRKDAEKDMDFRVLGTNAAQQSSKLASKGDYRKAQANIRGWRNMMHRNIDNEEQEDVFNALCKNAGELNRGLQSAQIEEIEQGHMEMGSERQGAMRKANRNDKLSAANYKAKKAKKDCIIM